MLAGHAHERLHRFGQRARSSQAARCEAASEAASPFYAIEWLKFNLNSIFTPGATNRESEQPCCRRAALPPRRRDKHVVLRFERPHQRRRGRGLCHPQGQMCAGSQRGAVVRREGGAGPRRARQEVRGPGSAAALLPLQPVLLRGARQRGRNCRVLRSGNVWLKQG